MTTSAPGQLPSGDHFHLILHASLPRFPEKKLELSIRSGIEPSTSKASRRLHCIKERCFDQVYKYPLFASDILFVGFSCFFIFPLSFYTASVRLVFGMVSFSSPGNTSTGRCTTSASSICLYFFHLPHHYMAGSGAGIWMHLQLGRDFHTGGLPSFGLFPCFFLCLFLVIRKEEQQQCTTLGRVRDRNSLLDSRFPDLSTIFLHPSGIQRLSWEFPKHTTNTWIPMDPTTLASILSLALFPTYE